ncbi:MAG TPA: protein tyrosine phosphatase [Pirellulaceae bacterium]|jgi:predicted protein tyrosine phosphatase|nr:protein tyrosine phosphatase [Pirellulaceae bacterium]
MSRPRWLFLCGKNLRRSPTAAAIYANDPRVDVRSAGVSPQSRRIVTERDLDWATLLVVMERKHAARLRDRFPRRPLPTVVSLDIEDAYELMDEELIERIRQGCELLLEG